MQQLLNRHQPPTRIEVSVFGFLKIKDVENLGIKPEPTSFNQLQDGDCGDRLGNAGDAELGDGLHQDHAVRIAEASLINEFPVARDGKRRTGQRRMLFEKVDHQLVERRQPLVRSPSHRNNALGLLGQVSPPYKGIAGGFVSPLTKGGPGGVIVAPSMHTNEKSQSSV